MKNDNKPRPIYYGGRKSEKFVRCYEKNSMSVFRVELELHSRLLRDVSTLDSFVLLPEVIYPGHVQFVAWKWGQLEQHLHKKFGGGAPPLIAGARRRSHSLSRLRRYLRRKGVANLHRFLLPLPINDKIDRALRQWVRDFKKGALWANTK